MFLYDTKEAYEKSVGPAAGEAWDKAREAGTVGMAGAPVFERRVMAACFNRD